MKICTLTELCKKEVISIDCGKKLGYPLDIEVSVKHGELLNLIMPCKSTFTLLSGKNTYKIRWCDIERIGQDVIWVLGDFDRKDDCCDRNNKRDKGCC